MKTLNWVAIYVISAALSLVSLPCLAAETRIAVLDFELNDLTLMPRTPEELERTASIGPLLRAALAKKPGYELVPIQQADRATADVAFGYLFEHPDVTAQLGSRFGADWVAVGRLHKPSFLFAYLKVRVINVKTARIVGDYAVEIKGYLKKLAERGTAQLADQIDNTIRHGITVP
jgi:uncharacterized protein DUF2380